MTHSELNAILNYRGGSLEGAKLYVSLFPCNECAKAIIQAGITTVVYGEDKYPDSVSVRASKRMFDAAKVRYYPYHRTGRHIELELSISRSRKKNYCRKQRKRRIRHSRLKTIHRRERIP